MGAFLGLAGAVCWGLADFAARFSSRRIGAFRTLLYMQFFGCLALTIYLAATGGFHRGVAPGWRPWEMAVGAGLLNMASSLALYRSFEVGTMSIVAPVSSCYPALTAILAFLTGERIGPVKGAGLAVVLVGVILTGTSFSQNNQDNAAGQSGKTQITAAKGLWWAIAAAVGFGILFWFLGFYVVPAVGSSVSVWVMRLTAIIGMFLISAPSRQSVALPNGKVWWPLFAVGLMDTAAFIMNNVGLHIGPVSVVSVLASLYGAVTVVLSWIVLRERLDRSQWVGIFILFGGIVLVTL